jgi:hypothetical protein
VFNVGWVLGEYLIESPNKEQGIAMLRQAYEVGKMAGFPGAEEIGLLLRNSGVKS